MFISRKHSYAKRLTSILQTNQSQLTPTMHRIFYSSLAQEQMEEYPLFHERLQEQFPGATLMTDFFEKCNSVLTPLRFEDENTMGMAAICRDEITEPCLNQVIKYWGKTFNCCSIAGFITIGTTGLSAATHHCPSDAIDGKRRFVFVAMPHIAISKKGAIGQCEREGMEEESTACGALCAISGELERGQLNLTMNLKDVEQSLVRQRILSEMVYGSQPGLVDITKLASDIITKDVDELLGTLDISVYDYAVITGVQIHGPNDVDYVYPGTFYHASNLYENNRKYLEIPGLF